MMMIKIMLAIVNPLANLYLNKMPSATVLPPPPTRLLLGDVDNIIMTRLCTERKCEKRKEGKFPGKEAKDRV